MTSHSKHYRAAQSGFTLLELLLAMFLSTILLSLVFSGLSTYIKTSKAVTAAVDVQTKRRGVMNFIRGQLRAAYPLAQRGLNGTQVIFIGQPDYIAYIGRVPSHRASGGLFHNTIKIEAHEDSQRLTFSYHHLPLGSDWKVEDIESPAPLFTTTLLADAGEARLEYFGRAQASDEPEWSDSWPLRGWLPKLVRLTTTTEAGEQQTMVVGLRNEYARRRLAHQVPPSASPGLPVAGVLAQPLSSLR